MIVSVTRVRWADGQISALMQMCNIEKSFSLSNRICRSGGRLLGLEDKRPQVGHPKVGSEASVSSLVVNGTEKKN